MSLAKPSYFLTPFICLSMTALGAAQASTAAPHRLKMADYSVQFVADDPPRMQIERAGEPVFIVPLVAELDSDTQQEHLSHIQTEFRQDKQGSAEVLVSATSNL